jgi:PAS domain S-box-containing protein
VQAQKHIKSIVETMRESLLVLTADLKVISANQSFYQTFKVTSEETEGRFIYSIGNHQWDIPALRKLLEEIIPQNTRFNNFEVSQEFSVIGRRTMLLNARRIYREGKGTEMILLAIEDITERRQARRRSRFPKLATGVSLKRPRMEYSSSIPRQGRYRMLTPSW